jgi:bacterioferritin-associated ferredoxin
MNSMNGHGRRNKPEIICRCNSIDRATIEKAIRDGAKTMNEIFDATNAGVGPCGGSCRRKLQPMLEYYLAHGTFPEKIVEDLTGKVVMGKPDPDKVG